MAAALLGGACAGAGGRAADDQRSADGAPPSPEAAAAPPATPAEVLAAALAATRELSFSVSSRALPLGPGPVEVVMTGVWDFRTGTGELVIDDASVAALRRASAEPVLKALVHDRLVVSERGAFTHHDDLAPLGVPAEDRGKHWLYQGSGAGGFGMLVRDPIGDVDLALERAQAVIELTSDGGTRAFRVTVDPAAIGASNVVELVVDVEVDPEGLLRTITQRLTLSQDGAADTMIRSTVELADPGVGVEVSEPSPDDVVQFDELAVGGNTAVSIASEDGGWTSYGSGSTELAEQVAPPDAPPLADLLGIFTDPARTQDALPPSIRPEPLGELGIQAGANVRLLVDGPEQLFAVEGSDGSVCPVLAARGGAGVRCLRSLGEDGVTWETVIPGGGPGVVYGLAIDDVAAVALRLESGGRVVAELANNGFVARVSSVDVLEQVAALEVTYADGVTRTIELGEH